MLTQRSLIILATVVLMLPLLGIAALLWRRFYRDDPANPVRRIFKNSAVPTALRVFVKLLDLIFIIVLNAVLGTQDGIGSYYLAALLVGMYLSTFTDFGLGVLLTREVAKDADAAPRLFGMTLALRLLLVGISIPLVGVVIGIYQGLAAAGIGDALSPIGEQAMWVLALTLIPGAFSNAVTALYNARERMEVPAMMEVVTALLNFLGRAAMLFLGFGILGVAWSAVVVTTLTALVFLGLMLRDFFRPRLRWDWTLMAATVPIALPLMLNGLLNAVFFRFDTFIVKAFGQGNGEALVIAYHNSYQLINIAMVVPPALTFAIFPTLARHAAGQRTALAQAQNRTLQVLLLVAFPLAMGISVLAPDLLRLLTTKNADEIVPLGAPALAILAWFLPLSFVNGLIQYVLIAIDQQRLITRAFVIAAVFNLLANLAFIPFYGLYAAATITILSEIVLLLVFLPMLRKEHLTPPLLHLFWRPALAALAMGAAMVLVYGAVEPQFGWFGASAAAALTAPLIYAPALWLLGAFGPDERALARRLIGR